MFTPINIIDFINNSNIFNGDIFTATYKNGTIVSAGEGGNHHIYFLSRPLNKKDNFKYYDPSDAVHICLDSHLYDGKYHYFLSVHKDTPKVFLKYGREEDRVCKVMYYTEEDIINIFREWIASLK